jgi:hypothetical protein
MRARPACDVLRVFVSLAQSVRGMCDRTGAHALPADLVSELPWRMPEPCAGSRRMSSSPQIALSSGLRRFLWPQGEVQEADSPWLSQTSRTVLLSTLVMFAALDVVHPLPALTGEWWFAFFVLWVTPWRRPVFAGVPGGPGIGWGSALILFSWLIYRTQTAAAESLSTWFVFKSSPWWRLLSFPMQTTLAAIVTATLTVTPLRKIVGARATALAVIASLPYSVNLAAHTIRWNADPLAKALHVYNALMPMLIIAEASSLLTRYPIRVDSSPFYRRLRMFAVGLLCGELNALIALFVLYCGSLAGCFLVERLWAAQDQTTPGFLAIYSVAVPVSFFIVLLSAAATWRSLARAGRRHVIIDNLATFGRVFLMTSVGLVAPVGFFFLMPRTGHALSEAVQLLPGPAWSISPTKKPGELRLSGELQYGVSDALASVLTHDPRIRRLELDSPGGLMEEGFAIAKLVESHSLTTVVKRTCASACTIAFVSGRERVLAAGAKLGFHRARSSAWDDALYDDDKYNDRVIDYFESKGITASFAQKAYSVPNADTWYPSVDELLSARVISAKP